MAMERTELAASIFRVAHLTGTFRLRSGVEATEYFDKYRFESDPRLLAQITAALSQLVPPETAVLAGLELGGIPLATMLSQATGLPAVFVRKAAKEYGTCQLAEGGHVSGRVALLVEDVVTSGSQLIESAKALRAMGAIIRDAVCVIDREAGGNATLQSHDITLRSLFRMSELKAAASLTA
jgi:orotate phosphoribosyltransferase